MEVKDDMNCISNAPCEECEYGHCVSNRDDCEEYKCHMPEDLKEAVDSLVKAFPNSFINERGEFIAHLRTNQYIVLHNCKSPLDIECKVLEWFSRPACKTQPYSQEWRNRKFQEFMRNGVNDFLDTSFTEADMFKIYDALGNCIHHQKTIDFIESDYDFDKLN